ncbi:MAG: cytochrome P460 family protein [Candidatus Acidiferrales bacterium]
MLRKLSGVFSLVLLSLTLGARSTISAAGNEVPFPANFRDSFVVNSMIVTLDSPISAQIGGLHIIYVNATGLPVLKKGGTFPYPDGTVFADDVHDFAVKGGSYVEGAKKAVSTMVKDSKKYTATGGWGFQAWAGGDPSKPLIPDTVHAMQDCFVCHSPQQTQDFVFSTYIP